MLYHIDVTDEEYLPYNYDLLFHYVFSYGVSCISNRNCLPGNAERGRGCALPSIKPKGTEVIVHYYNCIHMLSPCGNLCVCYAKYV